MSKCTLIEGWASLKSFRPKGEKNDPGGPGNPWSDFHGEKRGNDTHESSTDPETKRARKSAGKEARRGFGAHAAMENRHGLCVLLDLHPAPGAEHSEPRVAAGRVERLRERGFTPKSVGADKNLPRRQLRLGGCVRRAWKPIGPSSPTAIRWASSFTPPTP